VCKIIRIFRVSEALPAAVIRVLKRVLYRSAFGCISHHERSEAFYRKKRAEG
jgi:hypothetical protein